MKSQFFDQKMFNDFEGPMQKLMELNVKMMQNLFHIKPVDLLNTKNPEDIFEKNMLMLMQNSQMALNYMRDTMSLMESHWLNVSRNVDQGRKKSADEMPEAMKKSPKKSMASSKGHSAKKVAKPKNKSAAKPIAKSAAKPIAKSAAKPMAKSAAKPATGSSVKKTMTSAKRNTISKDIKVATPTAQSGSSMMKKEPVHANTPKVGRVTEKPVVKDIGMQNINKGQPFSG